MNDVQEPAAPPRRLFRSTDDRMIAGVCGGIAAYTGIDPVVIRVALAVATVVGGAGVVAYAIAWVVIPSVEQELSHAEAVLRGRHLPRTVLIGGAVVVGVLALGLIDGLFVGDGPHLDGGGLGLIVLVGIALWLYRREGPDTARIPPVPPVPPVPPTPQRPLVADREAAVHDAPPTPPRPPGERSGLSVLTVSVLLLVAGTIALLQVSGAADVDADVALPIGLLVVGSGLLVGAWRGQGRPLIALGLVLVVVTAVASVADVPLAGGMGERDWRPLGAADLHEPYRLVAGKGVLDLSDLELDAGSHRLEASIGLGHLVVRLPGDADIHIRTHTGAGRTGVLDRDDGGVDATYDVVVEARSPGRHPVLELDLRVGIGHLEVIR